MTTQVYFTSDGHGKATPSPSYSALPGNDNNLNPFSPVHRFSEDSSTADLDSDARSIATAPPPYSASTTFTPTHQLQIETVGKSVLSLPLPPRADPIPIFSLSDPSIPQFVSLRPSRGSGSCFLVSPSLSPPQSGGEEELHIPFSTTFYRCGPGRHPRIRLFAPGTATPTANPFADGSSGETDSEGIELATWDAFELEPVGLLTRAITFRSRLGTFEWRYAGRKERRAMGVDSGSILVLDRVVRVAVAGGNRAKDEVVRTPVARLVRAEGLRTPGSSGSSAGNGGRLQVDLRLWEEDGGDGASKLDREMALVMVTTTCLAMLKKEIDRRRAQQMAIMMGAASGGGP